MAFSLGNTGQSPFGAPASAAGGVQVQSGSDLLNIQTEGLGFLAIAGESKIKLLPTPWPNDRLPPPTSSLLSIASRLGLLAAAGPDAVILANTEAVRNAFNGPKTGDSHVRSFQPQLTLPMPTRVSQIAFTSDENYLILSAESGGGLAIYDVQSLLNGSTTSAFEMPTEGLSIRALIPNPAEKPELVAIVLTDGKLMIANLKDRGFVMMPTGQVLKEAVSCVSWSSKGKQVVAGLADGSAYQMTPEGVCRAEIPRPPNVQANHHVSSISWLENDVFLMIHTPNDFSAGMAPESIYHVVTRAPKTTQYMAQKISDPAEPFGMNRYPPHHFLLRIKGFEPNLQDLIIVSSTASTDVGLLSKSSVPLASDKPAESISNIFTMTELADDSRRAQLPTSIMDGMSDTSPIGLALDLSSKDKVAKPIPSEEMEASPGPLPGVMLLNNEGVLASWWVVYSESIRQNTTYSGLVAATSGQPTQNQKTPAFGSPAPSIGQSPFGSTPNKAPAFGASSFGSSGFNKPAAPSAPAFGTPAFGSASSFGAASGLNKPASVWGAPAASSPVSSVASTREAVFGSATKPNTGLAFGASGLPGAKVSPWTSQSGQTSGSAFGTPSSIGGSTSVFGTSSGANTSGASTASGFASFAQTSSSGGFAGIAAQSQGEKGSVFGAKLGSTFGGPLSNPLKQTSSSFGTFGNPPSTSTGGIFGNSPTSNSGSVFGNAISSNSGSTFGSQGFVLGSTFKGDGSAKDDLPKPADPGGSLFGNAFGAALGTTNSADLMPSSRIQEADMEDDNEPEKAKEITPQKEKANFLNPPTPGFMAPTSTTPSTTPAPLKFGSKDVALPQQAGLFGAPFSALPSTPTSREPSKQTEAAATNSDVTIKQEPSHDVEAEEDLRNIPEAPLPPDTTSKSTYAAGESSSSSNQTDAPLPPDFAPPLAKPAASTPPIESQMPPVPAKSIYADMLPPMDVPGGPEEVEEEGEEEGQGENESDFESQEEDGESEGFEEGSGEDVTKDLSPTSEHHQTPGFTPQSSFKTTADSSFTKITHPSLSGSSRQLFGEIGGKAAPALPPPKPFLSPRSPSPVRGAIPNRLIRPDTSRSVSAPGAASQLLSSSRGSGNMTSTFALTMEQRKAEEKRQADRRAQKEADEAQALVDQDDESAQSYLAAPIVATKHLDEFVAHNDYVGRADNNSIPGQVEAVYRDINSMIDTLGMNSRALQSFVKGHTEGYKDDGRSREDLANNDDWCLGEVENLNIVITKDLTKELAYGAVKNVAQKVEVCKELERDLVKIRGRYTELSMILAIQSDPTQLAAVRSQPLSPEQTAQMHDLRRTYTSVQKSLAEVEESLTLLRTKLVTQGGGKGKPRASVPTVEAVMRTIMKMTSMAEKRSGDIDVLENQMRKLRMSSVASNASRENSPFATPANKSVLRNPGTAESYNAFYTPDSIKNSPSRFKMSLASSVMSPGESPIQRKKLSGFTSEERQRLKANSARRKDIIDRLSSALKKQGGQARVIPLGED